MTSHGCNTSLAETQEANKEQHHFSVLKFKNFEQRYQLERNMASH
jgi:hypothetical protein